MSEAFITRRGGSGGLSANNAVLHVNAPVGSTITLAKGGVTVKVLDASKGHISAEDSRLADWYYAVSASNYGTWTVTASNGTNSTSATVTINANKQYDVGLTYDLYLLKNGLFQFAHDKGDLNETQYNGYVSFKSTYSSARMWVPLTAEMLGAGTYTKLVFNIRSTYITTGDLQAGLSSATSYSDVLWLSYANIPEGSTGAKTLTVDISNFILSGKYAMIKLVGGSNQEFSVTDIYLAW